MKYHYTYRITNTILNLHYYGTRTSTNRIPTEDIGIYYFSSSSNKEFINDQKNNPLNYKYKVIRIYNTRKEAIEQEIKLHNKFNVGVNEKFYNIAKQTSVGFDFDFTGISCSKEKKLKISKSLIGHTVSKEARRKISLSKIGRIYLEETKIKMRNSHKDKHNGSDNNAAIEVGIYDNLDNLKFTSHGDFMKVCEKNNLPSNAFKKSYQNNTKIGELQATKYNYKEYIGWYAIKHL
jgi:hypothetical protein